MLLLVLGPALAAAETRPELLDEWEAIQTRTDRAAMKAWWCDLDSERLLRFIEAGVDVDVSDDRGWTPLHSAARYSTDPAVTRTLLHAGAAVGARDRAGDTPLHWAAAANPEVEVVTALLAGGADVNERDRFGWQPLHSAAERSSNPEILAALLTAGAERGTRAYFVFFRPAFLLRHNANMADADKRVAMAHLGRGE